MSDLPCVALESTVPVSWIAPFRPILPSQRHWIGLSAAKAPYLERLELLAGLLKTDLNRDEIRLLCQGQRCT